MRKTSFRFCQRIPGQPILPQKPPSVPAANSKDTKSTAPSPLVKAVNWTEAALQLYQVPLKTGNFRELTVADNFIYWLDDGVENTGSRKLFALKIEANKKPEPIEIAAGINGYQLSANKKKLLLMKRGAIAIADANGTKIDFDKSKIEIANWSFQVDPVEDWKQMFADAWRMMRDYFYDRDMHKVDWMAVRNSTKLLLDRVTDRTELDDLIAQMISELSVLHAFVSGSDRRKSPDDIQNSLPGCIINDR
jgi:tricorn protease